MTEEAVIYEIEAEPRQGTPEWHEWRKGGIGASEIAAVLGISPWKTAFQLFQEKTGGNVETFVNAAMRRGNELEAAAIFDLEVEHSIEVDRSRTLFEHATCPYLRASLDGMTHDGIVVEVKCPGLGQYEAMREAIPDYYMAQVQQQMLVTEASGALFWVWHPERGGYLHQVEPDEKWRKRIIEAGGEFWQRVESGKWPTDGLAQLAEELAWAKARLTEAEKAKKAAETALIEAMAADEAKKIETASGIKATVIRRKIIDRVALENDPQWIDLKPYLDELNAKKKEIEAQYKTGVGAPYIRLTMP